MLYENYRKKIIKVADILKTVRKFRVLIITFLIALLCVMAVLLGIQGVVFDMSTPPAVIVYGQPFEYEAGAVMGSVRYEYAEEGSDEWTAAQPVRAGSYKVRAVAKGAFGGDRYGAVHSFTIEPKPIDVTLAESSAVYGEQPLLTADLAFSDVIRCVAFSYDYSQAEADISEGTEIRVFDENGEDVTSSYTFRSVEGTLLIEQRAVAITTDSAEKVYDGTPLTDPGYTVSADTPLAENDSVYIDDEADLTVQATITAAGSVENSLAFFFKKSITVDGEELFVDVTSNYAQEITSGTLTVKKRPVTFETASQSWVYDGEAHSNGGHVIAEGEGEYGLLNGHMMAVDESTLPQATEAGEVQNAFTIRIESAGEDMTDNYDVTYSYGTLTIKPRPVIFVTEGHEWVYDGEAHSWGGHSVAESAEEEYGLVEGHASAAVGFTYVTNVADSGAANALTVAVYDGERDVTGNYAISYDEENAGKLTIKPRSVTFVTEGHEWVYDGEAHSWGGHSVAQGSENGLAEGHTSEAVAFTYVTDVADSGAANALMVAVYDGEQDVTGNYAISYDEENAGKLTITPRAVVIETATDDKVYDGTPLENGGCSDSGNGTYELVEGHSPVRDGAGTLPSVTDVLYDEAQHVIGLENIFAVRILDADDTDRTDNYAIGYDYGTLTVTPRAVVIATATDKKVYDGTPLENGGCFDSGKGTYELVEGHSPVWDGNGTLPSVTDVLYEDGKVVGMENAFAVRILDADGTDRTDNYAVGYDYGTLTVTPRPITVRSDSAEKVYDAASLTAHGCEITEGTLAAEQTLTADYTGSVTNVWESAEENNLFTVTIRDAAENNVTANYAVTYEYGTLTITPRPIVVTAASGEKVYDAEPFGTDDFVGGEYYLVASDADPALAPPVVAGQTLAVETQLPESADVYEGGAHTVVSVTVWAGGTEVTANYAIRTENGAVTIKPRTVTFVTESRSWVYDGEAHSWDRHAVAPTSEHGLVEGHTSRATELVYITDVLYGEDGDVAGIPNALVIEVYDADGAPVAAGNYSILYECGTLTVTPRPIVVTAASGEKVYDGMPFGTDDFAGGEYYLVASGADPALDPPVAAGQTLEVGTQLPESADVYESGAHTVVSVTVWADGTDVTANYAIETADGTVTITPRPIVVTAGSGEKMYDDTPFGYDDFTDGMYYLVASGADPALAPPVVAGQTLEVRTQLPESADVYESGAHTVVSVKVWANGTEVTANYSIRTEDGTVTIAPRPITVTAGSADKVYDGTPLVCATYNVTSDIRLVEGHTLTAKTVGSRTDVGSSPNEIDEESVTIFSADGRDVRKNYDVTCEAGTLVVTPRAITIVTGSKTWVYDGNAHSWYEDEEGNPTYYLAEGSTLADGQSMRVEDFTEITDAGSVENALKIGIYDKEGVSRTSNYTIGYDKGTLTVTKRSVTIVTEGHEWVYDGETHSWDGHSVSEGSAYPLVSGHRTEVVSVTEITNVWESPVKNVLGIRIVDEDGNNVTQNYEPDYEYGTLIITPRPIVVTAAIGEKVYDGMPFGTDDFAGGEYYFVASGADPALEPPVAAGQTLAVETQLPESADVYEGGAHTVVSVTVWADDTEVTKNYSIETADGTVTIAPRPITVTADSDSKVYDGTPLIVDTFTVSSEYEPPLVLDHYADVQVEGAAATDVCENVPNKVVSVHIYAGDGTDVTGNYAVTTEDGTLTITPRPITVTAGSDTKVYDGTPLTCSEATVSSALSPALVLDHEIRFAVSGSQTEIGESENTLTYAAVFTADGTDVSYNYQITEENGTLTVLVPGVLVVRTGGAEKIFDGTALTNAEYTIESTLGENFGMQFTVEVTCTGSQLHAGETENTAEVRVTDASGKDVTEYTQIEYELGSLIVAPRPAKVVTGSQTWEYDGQAHSYPDETRIEAVEYDGVTYGLVQGHEAVFTDHAEIVMPGTMENDVTVTVTDGGTIDFTDDYEFEYELGTLEIIDSSGGDGGDGGAGDLDTSGELGGGGLGGEGAAFRVYADVSANIYMRLLSFGNYNGGGWVYAPEYGQLLDGAYGMNYLTGAALAEAGYTSSQIAVEMYTHDYLLPDYMAMGAGNYTVQTSDVWYKGDASQVYSLPYYVYEYLENGAPTAGLGGYAAAEEAYRAFVYDNYLTVRESARACMQAIIAEQGFRADDPAIVAKVAAYIQNAAAYNLEYDRAMDDEADVVVAFLTKYKEGICQHYASAATLLFRMLGIPARYTIGYAGATSAGEWVETGIGHAWTEVYLDGVGWVHVEVTGGGPGGGGGSGQQEEITIKPVNKTKQYDGTPLTADAVQGADEKSAMLLNELLTEGYFYKAEFAGSITEPGTTESTIENFVLYDPQGAEAENVTFTFEPGTLTVVSNILITIHPYVLQKYYDGTQLAYKADDYWVSGLQSGWRIEGFSMEGIGLTDVGAITADSDEILERLVGVRVYDESGILRTEGVDYTLVIDGSTLLTVDRRAITVSSYSDTKQYDGTPLTNDKCWISSGSLANGHIFEATVTGSITDVGTKQNTIGAVIIRDGDGNEVTKNYNIVFSPGWLTVLDG